MVYSTRRFVLCLTLCHFVLVLFSPFSIAITSLGEERANLSAFRTFVRFVLVWICPLPRGVWEGLRFVIVALPGLFSYLFFCIQKYVNIPGQCHSHEAEPSIDFKGRRDEEKHVTKQMLPMKPLINKQKELQQRNNRGTFSWKTTVGLKPILFKTSSLLILMQPQISNIMFA